MKTSNGFLIFGQHLISIFYVILPLSVLAEIVPDNTLPINSRVTPQGNISNITGGTQVGNNLFHSFEQFSLSTNITAYFNNSLNVQNIISRVTGNSISNIDGLLKANYNANLFLINPNGMIFGSNASLDIGGSFLATTASRINFADGSQFSAKTLPSQPLLTVSAPVGLEFDSNPGTIQVQGKGHNLTLNGPFSPFSRSNSSNGLRIKPEKTLALMGGDIALEGGKLEATGGRIELGSVSTGIVSINTIPSGWTFNYENASSFKNIQLSQESIADVSGLGSGFIQAQGADIELVSGSIFLIQNQGNKLSGDIIVNASEELRMRGTSLNGIIPTSLVNETLLGDGGRINISTPNLIIEDGASIIAKTYSAGRGGDIIVNASEFTKVVDSSASVLRLPSNIITATFGSGDSGNLTIFTKRLSVQGGGEILTSTFSNGKGGNLTVNTPESTQVIGYLSGNSQLSSTILTRASGSGNAGNLFLSTGLLSAKEGGIIGSLTLGNGSGGDVTVNSNNTVELIGVVPNVFTPSSLTTSTYSNGNSGKLTVNTRKLTIRDGGVINTSTRSIGKADSLIINASDSIDIIGKSPESVNPSLINSSVIDFNGRLQQLYRLPSTLRGDAGSIIINTTRLNVADGALVSVRNDGSGNAGTLQINADQINITNNSGITATTAVGEGGDIKITSKILQLNNGNISVTAGQQGSNGNGGNISIDTDILVGLNSSRITANAFKGKGGNIRIRTQGLFLSPNSLLTASSQQGINGTIETNTSRTQPELDNVQLELPKSTPEIASVCPGRAGAVTGKFVARGRESAPDDTDKPLYNRAFLENSSVAVGEEESLIKKQVSLIEETTQIIPAQAWVFNSNGQVTLVATNPNQINPDSLLNANSCSSVKPVSQLFPSLEASTSND